MVSAASQCGPETVGGWLFRTNDCKAPARVNMRAASSVASSRLSEIALLMLDLQSATANMYLETPLGRKRVLALNTDGRFRVWLIPQQEWRSVLAEVLRREASALIPITGNLWRGGLAVGRHRPTP